MNVCPADGCSYEGSETGIKVHYGKIHDGSISGYEIVCEHCGDTFRFKHKDRRFCPGDCYHDWRREQDNSWLPDESREIMSIAAKEREHTEEGLRSISESKLGENNPNWSPRPSHEIVFGENWAEVKEVVLERDDYKCIECGDGKDELGRLPNVHHIVPRSFVLFHPLLSMERHCNSLDNLVTLCNTCHVKYEGDYERFGLPEWARGGKEDGG